jgi:HK97 family phage prohead protease
VLEVASTRSRQQLRSDDDGAILYGLAAPFGNWTKIDSTFEGEFLERVAAGAFKRTLAERGDKVRCLFQHGMDPQIGDKPLGPLSVLEERTNGLYYEVPLLGTSYNADLALILRSGLLGASFRFRTVHEQFSAHPPKSAHNPHRLPERTLRDLDLHELGPVTFPAYESATADVRSARPRAAVPASRSLRGRGLVTPVRRLSTLGDGTLVPGYDRLALSHPAVRAKPEAFTPADSRDTLTRSLHRDLVTRSRRAGNTLRPAKSESWRLRQKGRYQL